MELLDLPDDLLLVVLVTAARMGPAPLAALRATCRRLRALAASLTVARASLGARLAAAAPFVAAADVRARLAEPDPGGCERRLFAPMVCYARGNVHKPDHLRRPGIARQLLPE
mgnify:CR=1 FL=1